MVGAELACVSMPMAELSWPDGQGAELAWSKVLLALLWQSKPVAEFASVWRLRLEVSTRVLGVSVSRCLFSRSWLLGLWSFSLCGSVGRPTQR